MQSRATRFLYRILSVVAVALLFLATVSGNERQFLPRLIISSTIPANGDLNPYGVALVPRGFPEGGTIAPGDILVSNFNGSGNAQGTGTTIINSRPTGL